MSSTSEPILKVELLAIAVAAFFAGRDRLSIAQRK